MYATPTFKLNGRNIERILGKLESRVMLVIWDKGQVTIKEVQETVSRKSPPAFTTIMTTMNRLVKKGLLQKDKEGRFWIYTPKLSKEEFINSFSRKVVKGLLDDFGQYAVAHFVEEVEKADPELLKKVLKRYYDGKNKK